MISFICRIKKEIKTKQSKTIQACRHNEQIGDRQRRGQWLKWVKGAERKQLPVINKSWRCNIQHSDYS